MWEKILQTTIELTLGSSWTVRYLGTFILLTISIRLSIKFICLFLNEKKNAISLNNVNVIINDFILQIQYVNYRE